MLSQYGFDGVAWRRVVRRGSWLEVELDGFMLRFGSRGEVRVRVGGKWRRVVDVKFSDLVDAFSVDYIEGRCRKTMAKLYLSGRLYDLCTRVVLRKGEVVGVVPGGGVFRVVSGRICKWKGLWSVEYLVELVFGERDRVFRYVNGCEMWFRGSDFNVPRRALVRSLGDGYFLRIYLDNGSVRLQSGRRHYYVPREGVFVEPSRDIYVLSFKETRARVVFSTSREAYSRYLKELSGKRDIR